MVARVNGDKMKTFPKAAHKTLFYWSGNSNKTSSSIKISSPHGRLFLSTGTILSHWKRREKKKKKTPHHRLVSSDQFWNLMQTLRMETSRNLAKENICIWIIVTWSNGGSVTDSVMKIPFHTAKINSTIALMWLDAVQIGVLGGNWAAYLTWKAGAPLDCQSSPRTGPPPPDCHKFREFSLSSLTNYAAQSPNPTSDRGRDLRNRKRGTHG